MLTTPEIVCLDYALWSKNQSAIMEIEVASYEPKRRHTHEFLVDTVRSSKNASLAAFYGNKVVGYCFAGPLKLFPHKRGTQTDPNFGRGNTLYSADLAVTDEFRNRGLARRLKTKQMDLAIRNGYDFIAGRNRVGIAKDIWRINLSLGAKSVQYLKDEYDDDLGPRDCQYFQIDLRPIRNI